MVSGGDGESTLRCCINWCRDTSDAVLCGRARRNLRLPAISIPLSPWPSCRGAEPLRSHWCPMPSGCSPFLNTWPFMAVPFLKGLELGLLPGLPAVLTPQGCPVPGTAEGPMGPIRSIVLLLFGQKAKIKKKKKSKEIPSPERARTKSDLCGIYLHTFPSAFISGSSPLHKSPTPGTRAGAPPDDPLPFSLLVSSFICFS